MNAPQVSSIFGPTNHTTMNNRLLTKLELALGLITIFSLMLLLSSCSKDSKTEPTPAHTITSISQSPISPGVSFTVTGANFDATAANNTLKLGSIAVAVQSATTTTLTTTLPQDFIPGTYELSVTVRGTTAKLSTQVEVTPDAPSITSFTPAFALEGATVTITGTNFSTTPSNNSVRFGAIAATVTAASATQLSVTIPSGLTLGTTYQLSIAVTENNKTSSIAKSSTNFALAVSITSINPATAIKNTPLTITGINFDPNNSVVEINGKPASITASTSTSITVTVPKGAGTGAVTVKAYNQTVNGPTLTFKATKSYNVSSQTTFISDNAIKGIQSIALDTVNNKLYVGAGASISWPAGVYAYSTTDGSNLTSLSTYYPSRMTVGPDGTVYESGGLSLRNDTQSTFVKYNSGGSSFAGVAYRNGLLYSTTNYQLVKVDPTVASPTPVVVNSGLPQYVIGFAMDKSASTCYLSNNWASLDKLDVATGNITHLLTSLANYYSIATDNTTNNVYFTGYNTTSGVYLYDQEQQLQVTIGQVGGDATPDLAVRYTSTQITVYVSDINGKIHKIVVDTPLD